MSVSVGTLTGTLTLNEDLSSKLSVAARKLTEFGRRMEDVGGKISKAGQGLTAGLTAPILALGTITVTAATKFESSFAGVRKTVNATEAEFAKLEKEIRALAAGPDAVPIDVNKLNAVAEAAGQLGIAKDDIVAFTRSMADLGETTNLTADEAATAIAQFQNIFGAAGKEVDRFGSTLVALGNDGASTEKQILDMGVRIAAAGVQIGLTQGEVLAVASTLSSLSIEAEAGGSAISKVMIDIALAVSKGGKELEQFAEVSGMSAEEFTAAFQENGVQALDAFISGLGRMKDAGGNVLGTLEAMGITEVRMRNALLSASSAGGLLTKALDLQARAWKENTALSREAAERYKTFESQLRIIGNQLKDVAITMGQALIPILRDLVSDLKPAIDTLAQMATQFGELPRSTRTAILALASLIAAAGPVVFVAGQIVAAWGGIAIALPAIGTAIGAVVAFLTGPAGWIAAGAALLVAWKPTRDFIADLASVIADNLTSAFQEIVKAGRMWWESIEDIRTPLAELLSAVADLAAGELPGLIDRIKSAASAILEWWRSTEDARKFTLNFARAIREDLSAAIGKVVSAIKTIIDWYGQWVGWVIKVGKAVAESVVQFLNWTGILPVVRLAINGIISGLSLLWSWLVKAKDKLLEWVNALGGWAPVLSVLNPALGASVALLSRWSERAKELSKNNKDAKDSAEELRKESEKKPEIPPPSTVASTQSDRKTSLGLIGGTSEEQQKSLDAIKQRISEMERESRAAKDVLAVVGMGPEAYSKLRREQEIGNAVFEARQALLEAEIALTPELESRIRSAVGATYDANEATGKLTELLERSAQSAEQSRDRISTLSTALRSLTPDAGVDTLNQLTNALQASSLNIRIMEAQLSGLPESSEQARQLQAQLRLETLALGEAYSEAALRIKTWKDAQDEPARESNRAFRQQLVDIREMNEALEAGPGFVVTLERTRQINAQVEKMRSSVKKLQGETGDEWAKRWLAAAQEIRQELERQYDLELAFDLKSSLRTVWDDFEILVTEVNHLLGEGLLTEKEAQKIVTRAHPILGQLFDSMAQSARAAADNISSALSDALVGAATGEGRAAWDGYINSMEQTLKKLIADWLAQWFRAMQQWLAKWIATQATAKAASATLGAGGSTGGGIGSNIGGLAGGAAGAGGAGGASSTLIAGGATVAIFAALYIGVSAWIRSHKKYATEVTFQLRKDVDAAVNSMSGDAKAAGALIDSVKAMSREINELLRGLGGALSGFSELVSIGRKGRGKNTKWYVELESGLKQWFSTYEEAMDAAMLAAVQSADISGFTALMREGLKGIEAENLEDLISVLSDLREISQINYNQGLVSVLGAVQALDQLWDTIARIPSGAQGVIDGIGNLIANEARRWQDLFDSLTGRQKTEGEIRTERETDLRIAKAELEIRKATIAQRILLAKSEILALQAGNTFIGGAGGAGGRRERGSGSGGGIMGVAYAFAMAGKTLATTTALVAETVIDATQAMIDALNAEIAGLEELLKALGNLQIPDINFGPVGGAGGGPDRGALRDDLRKELARMRAELKGGLHLLFFDLQQAIDDFTERAKEAKLPAAELAEIIGILTQKFQADLRARAEQMAGIGTDFTRRIKDTLDFFRELRELGRKKSGMPDWLVALLEGKALEKLGTEINSAIAAFNGMIDPMLAIHMQAAELRENFLAWAQAAGLSSEEIAKGLAAIESGKEFQRQNAITGIMETIFGYLKDAPEYAGKLVEFEKMKIDLQFRIIEAQLKALGAWDTGTQKMVEDAKKIANELAEGGRELDRSVARFRGYNDSESDPWRRIQDYVHDQTQAFRSGIKELIESTQDLLTDDQLSNLTQDQQLAAARSRLDDLIVRARGGDIEALRLISAARSEFLSELRESEAGGAGFTEEWSRVMRDTADLLSDAVNIEQDVVARAWAEALAANEDNTEDITIAIYDSARIVANAIYESIGGVPALARGGVVMSGPRLVRISEYSPEAVIPLDRLGRIANDISAADRHANQKQVHYARQSAEELKQIRIAQRRLESRMSMVESSSSEIARSNRSMERLDTFRVGTSKRR